MSMNVIRYLQLVCFACLIAVILIPFQPFFASNADAFANKPFEIAGNWQSWESDAQ
jgi:hypothetical protein